MRYEQTNEFIYLTSEIMIYLHRQISHLGNSYRLILVTLNTFDNPSAAVQLIRKLQR